MAYLRIFSPDGVSRECDLATDGATMGRAPDCDVVLADPSVSRLHAVIEKTDDGHRLIDKESRAGTLVNSEKVNTCPLRHGDSIQIHRFVLEYRTDDAEHSVEGDYAPTISFSDVKKLKYRYLPAGMSLRYRWIRCEPRRVFAPGDTIEVADGGILIPVGADTQPLKGNVIMEVELGWPSGQKRAFLSEMMDALPKDSKEVQVMCVKMHKIDKDLHSQVLDQCRCHDWITVGAPPA